jgi:ABC-type multidrug transport system ATPase subunit
MSEEILIALMQFYAIITPKSEDGSEDIKNKYVEKFLRSHLSANDVIRYMEIFNDFSQQKSEAHVKGQKKMGASVLDSIRILSICKKINTTLSREQKIIVLIRLSEYIKGVNYVNEITIDIIQTASEVFQIDGEDFNVIRSFLFEENIQNITSPSFCLLTSSQEVVNDQIKRLELKDLHGDIRIIRISNIETFFLLYNGHDSVVLNGLPINQNEVCLLARGGILKLPKDGNLYYADILACFKDALEKKYLRFDAEHVTFRFNPSVTAIHDVSLSEREGSLIALMGASGAGKTTLLNICSGLNPPTEGEIKINGINIYTQREKIKGLMGYIPQDDLLIEDLTVYENLFYNTQLCFADLPKEAIVQKVHKTLEDLGLFGIKDIKVGSPLNKKISGGQRKRLNIALELIREPEVLFVDEPTSGLSSRDSENVMDLLKELTLKGKIVFVVIHQPSSDIFKMFDKLFLLDVGGHPIYYGNPVEAVMYFKQKTNQLNSEEGECVTCGNVNPELIFNLVEAKVINDRGEFLDKRKVEPQKWSELYRAHELEKLNKTDHTSTTSIPQSSFIIPNVFLQWKIFLTRDIKSKIANLQYVLINLLEAPLLAFILASIVKYTDAKEGVYVFALNKNIPAFLFMSIIVALFMSLTLSAEEIIRDKKILKREALLDLSWSSYLFSKLFILFSITLFQTGVFLVIGKYLLGYHDLFMHQWLILFSVGCGGVLLGLLISSIFNSAVTIYILIPILLIPQMILSGAIFKFDELNTVFGNERKVPLIADGMIARWGYEALMVDAFVNNAYNQHFYALDQEMNQCNYQIVYYIPKLIEKIEADPQDSTADLLILNEVKYNHYVLPTLQKYVNKKQRSTLLFELDSISEDLNNQVNRLAEQKEQKIDSLVNALNGSDEYKKFKKSYHNKYVEEVLFNQVGMDYLIYTDHQLIRKKDLIYEMPNLNQNSYRTHFYAPKKVFFTKAHDTFYFNIIYIWFINIFVFLFIRNKWINKLFRL